MSRDIHIEEAKNGYIVRVHEMNSNTEIYTPPDEFVAANAAEVKGYLNAWVKKEAMPSKEDLGK